MNKEEIKKNLTIKWSDQDNCFLAETSDCNRVIGIGETKEEAEINFFEQFEDFLPYIQANKLINKGGRPKKNNVRLSCNISETSKRFIDENYNKKQGLYIDSLIQKDMKKKQEHVS